MGDLSTSELLLEVPVGKDARVNVMALSPDGTRVVLGCDDGSVRVWAGVGQVIQLGSHQTPVNSVSFSPDGGQVVISTGGPSGNVKLWPMGDGLKIQIDAEAARAFFTPWDDWVFLSPQGHLRIVKWPKGRVTDLLDDVSLVAHSLRGEYLAAVRGCDSRTIQLFELTEHGHANFVRTLGGHTFPVKCLAFSPDNTRLVSGSGDHTLRIHCTGRGASPNTLNKPLSAHSQSITAVSFSRDGKRIMSSSDDQRVILWDAELGVALDSKGHNLNKGIFVSIEFLPDICRVLLLTVTGKLVVWNYDWNYMIDRVRVSGTVAKLGNMESGVPQEMGGYGVVSRGSWGASQLLIVQPPPIAIKVIQRKRLLQKEKKEEKMIHKESKIWSMLKHPNIVPFLGITPSSPETPSSPAILSSLVSVWMVNGCILDYLSSHKQENRLEMVAQVARGLDFLHSRHEIVIHGDIKPPNILVNAKGQAVLTDFGISRVLDVSFDTTSGSSPPGTFSFMSPELMAGSIPKATTESDVFAFGVSAWSIMTCASNPYPDCKMPPHVLFAVYNRGERPDLELEHFDDTPRLRNLLISCWAENPTLRPNMANVVLELEKMSTKYRPLRLIALGACKVEELEVLRTILCDYGGLGGFVHEWSDLIGGSGWGGVMALLLGRMGMTVRESLQTCQAVQNLLTLNPSWTDEELASKISAAIASHFVEAQDMNLIDETCQGCRTVLITPGYLPSGCCTLRSYVSDNSVIIKFSVAQAILKLVRHDSFEDIDVDPTYTVLEEAKAFYGEHRPIGCMLTIDPSQTRTGLLLGKVHLPPTYMDVRGRDIEAYLTNFSRWPSERQRHVSRSKRLCSVLKNSVQPEDEEEDSEGDGDDDEKMPLADS